MNRSAAATRGRTLTSDEAARIETRMLAADMPRPAEEMRRLFTTDRYSQALELPVETNLFAL